MSFDPTSQIKPFPPRGEGDPSFTRLVPLIDAAKLKKQYLFGLRLKASTTNEELKPEDLNDFIVNAMSRVEHEAKINISPVKFTELHEYNLWDYNHYNFIQLNHWPVLQVEAVKMKLAQSEEFIQFPNDWLAVQNETGILQMVPKTGALSGVLMTGGGSILLPQLVGARQRFPQLFEITYTAGFEQDMVPAIVNDLVGVYASVAVLELLDSTMFQGSYSINLDGAGQSVGLPGPGWLQSRLTQSQARAAQLLDSVKRYYAHSLLLTSF